VVFSMWPSGKYFSHPSLVMYSFATPPIKLKLGQQMSGGLLIANHLDQSLQCANQKHWEAVRSYFSTLFSADAKRWCASFYKAQPKPCWIMRSQNHFP
jgi:hypothetical protein